MRKINNKIKLFPEKTVEAWSLGRTRRWLLRIENYIEGMKKVEDGKDSWWYQNDKDDLERHAKMLKEQGEIENEIICGIDWDNDTDLSDQSLFDAVHFQTK